MLSRLQLLCSSLLAAASVLLYVAHAGQRSGTTSDTMPPLTLYDYPLAYNPAKPRLMLVEKGLPFNTKVINLFNGQSLSPEYLRINHQGSVPSLVDSGANKMLTESLECVRYIDGLGQGPMGGRNVDVAFVQQWGDQVDKWDGNLFMFANTDERGRGVLAMLNDFKVNYAKARAAENPDLRDIYQRKAASLAAETSKDMDQAAVQANDERLFGLLDTAETRLKAAGPAGWLAGAEYSQADVLLSVVLFRIAMAKQQARYIEPRPAVQSYYGRVQARPSWKTAFGPALSSLGAAKLLAPALAKAWWAGLTGKY